MIAFRNFHPLGNSNRLNCESSFDEEKWQETGRAQADSIHGHGCRERITVTVEKEDYGELGGVAVIVEHIHYSRTIIDHD